MRSEEQPTVAARAAERLLRDRYQLAGRIGSGAIGEVVAAHDRALARDVAIKFLHPHLADDPDTVDRFRREARAIAQLSHRNVVRVFDFDAAHDPPFLVLELVDGITLTEVLRETGALEEQDWRSLAVQMLEALDAAHAAGIVHRDVKPANLLVERTGRLRVADFGLARTTSLETITNAGATVGTALYMSPEQAQGAAVGASSDIYSAGCVLWEMVTGSPPYGGGNAVEVAMRHVSGDVPDLRDVRPDVPHDVADLLRSMLAKDPAERPASAGAAAAQLLAGSALGEDGSPHATVALERTLAAQPLSSAVMAVTAPPDAHVYGGFPPRDHPTLGRRPLRDRIGPLADRLRATMPRELLKLAATALLVALLAWVVVERAPEGRGTPVPDYMRGSAGAMRQLAERDGWPVQVQQVDSWRRSGTVIGQDPPPGSRARAGEPIVLSVAR